MITSFTKKSICRYECDYDGFFYCFGELARPYRPVLNVVLTQPRIAVAITRFQWSNTVVKIAVVTFLAAPDLGFHIVFAI